MHLVFYAIYNAAIGYLVVAMAEEQRESVWVFGLAMGMHFVVVDFGLHEDFADAYHRIGRWVLAGAVLAGWLVGVAANVPEAIENSMIAFLAGGVIMNVLKEELPEKRQSRWWPFVIGATAYTVLLLVV